MRTMYLVTEQSESIEFVYTGALFKVLEPLPEIFKKSKPIMIM